MIVRSDHEIDSSSRDKIALFTNVDRKAVIPLLDAKSIYQIPEKLHEMKLDDIVVSQLEISCPPADLGSWREVVEAQAAPRHTIKLAMVGKYMALLDAYKSLNEAIIHAGIKTHTKVEVEFIEAQDLVDDGTRSLENADAILVPGGFGDRGFEGKVLAAKYARENKVPYLGICYGLHAAIVDIARNVAGLENANTTENNPKTPHPVIGLIMEWMNEDGDVETRDADSDLGGTMRMGEQECRLAENSTTSQIYGQDSINERHRHRYEVNDHYVSALEEAGMLVAGRSMDDSLVEVIEVKDHPWFVATQFHPEFTSTPRRGHPLFSSFIEAALEKQKT